MTIKYNTKLQLRAALQKAGDNKKEVYRILKVCESLGLSWDYRQMYGGGTNVSISDKLDEIVQIGFCEKYFIEFNDLYFQPNFKPTTWDDIRREQIRAEEAIYL